MKKKKQHEAEGLTSIPTYTLDQEDKRIFAFLEREKNARQAESRQIEHPSPIIARTKPMPSVFHTVLKPKKTLEQIWTDEDAAKRERDEE